MRQRFLPGAAGVPGALFAQTAKVAHFMGVQAVNSRSSGGSMSGPYNVTSTMGIKGYSVGGVVLGVPPAAWVSVQCRMNAAFAVVEPLAVDSLVPGYPAAMLFQYVLTSGVSVAQALFAPVNAACAWVSRLVSVGLCGGAILRVGPPGLFWITKPPTLPRTVPRGPSCITLAMVLRGSNCDCRSTVLAQSAAGICAGYKQGPRLADIGQAVPLFGSLPKAEGVKGALGSD